MGEVIKPGQMIKPFLGLGMASKSLGRPPKPYFSSLIKPLNSLGIDKTVIVYGDEATVEFMDYLYIKWGNTIPNVVDTLKQGYQYIWNVGKKTLTIIDASGNIETQRIINAWCDLAIESYILESHQFCYVLDANLLPEAFPIARRYIKTTTAQKQGYVWGITDEYLDPNIDGNSQLYFFCKNDNKKVGQVYMYFEKVKELQDILYGLIRNLSQTANYINLFVKEKDGHGKKIIVVKKAIMHLSIKYQMIYAVSNSILNADKHCYEPWMLWEMFKWISNSSFIEVEEKIFDLSPMW